MKQGSYSEFWQGVHAKADADGIPLRVMFELTYECNFRCRHCYVPRSFQRRYRKRQLRTTQVFSILEQLKDAGCLYLGFTGGEPFIRPDIFRILGYSRRLGFQSIIYTNGSLLDKKAVERLAEFSPNKVDITLPAMTEPVFESITGVRGSHRAVFRAIEALRKKKIPLGLKTCLLKQNAAEIDDIKNFCRCLEAPHRLDALLSCRLDGSPGPYRSRGGIPALKGRRLPAYRCSEGRYKPKKKASGTLFFCGAGNSQAAISPAGELKLCVMIDTPRYDILAGSFAGAWARVRAFVGSLAQTKNKRCNQCPYQAYCPWCPARGWLAKKSLTACDPAMFDWLEAQTIERYAGKH